MEKLHTVVSTHLLYVGSNCCKAQGLDESVEDRLSLNTPNVFIYIYIPLDLGHNPFYRRKWKGDIYKYKYNII